MAKQLLKFLLRIVESYLIVSALAIACGFIWPDTFKFFNSNITTFFLQIVFFLSSLKIDLTSVKNAFKDYRAMLDVNFFMLILLPVITFFLTKAIAPDLTIPLVLLAAMPTGMSTPLFVEIVNGNVPYSLVITVTTSLLAPITIPLVIKVLLGSVIQISILSMMSRLAAVIILPFILAQIYRRTLHKKIPLAEYRLKGLSIVLLGLLIAGIIANNIQGIRNLTIGHFVYFLVAVFVFYIFLHVIGYYVVFWKSKVDRMTTAIGVTYMNFVLSLYITSNYFPKAEVVVPIIISIIPWTILLIPYQKILKKLHKV